MKKPLSRAEIKLTTELYESELHRVKQTTPHPVHVRAVDRYKKDLGAVLGKINPKEHYWL